MANDPKTDALSTLRARLADHARDPRSSFMGLNRTVQAISAGFDELEARQAQIAKALALVSMNLRRSAVQGDAVYADDLVKLERELLQIAARR